jgi:hypothetical protein
LLILGNLATVVRTLDSLTSLIKLIIVYSLLIRLSTQFWPILLGMADKHSVRMFYSEMPMAVDVCFCEGNKQIGKRLRLSDSERIYDLLRAGSLPIEDHQIVEEALRQRKPGSVKLNQKAL